MKKRHRKAYFEYKEALKQENYEIAFQKLEYLYTDAPEDQNIKTIAKYELSDLCEKTNNIDKGIIYFENLLKNPIEKGYATLNLGKLEEYKGNIDKARKHYEELLNTKMKRFALDRLGSLEEKLGNYDEALKYFDMLKSFDTYRKKAFLKLLILNIKLENYNETLKYLEKIINKKLLSSKEINCYFTYIKYKMGIIDCKTDTQGYLLNQIVNYSKEEAIKHIKLHQNKNNNKANHGIFYEHLNISELYKNVKENFYNMNLVSTGICDKYIYDTGFNVGISNKKDTSFIQVVTICNTKDIITIFPVSPTLNYKDNKNSTVRKKTNKTYN